ncbi:MAG: hypothetical protein H6R19_1758 [Proteobacteria bacterium]|jgi:hypothetical protein|nr:hypothetical protein [Pseudomonadota bacterium]
MITTDIMPERVEMRAYGTVTLSDCKAFEEASNYRVLFNRPIDLLLDLRSMTGYSLDVAIEEWRYARAHPSDFRRIAVLTDDQFVTWGAWFSQFVVDADIRIFETERAARRWLDDNSLLEESGSTLH